MRLNSGYGRSLLLFGLLMSPALARAALIEDIVAWVNGEIITKSEYDAEEQMMIAEASRRYTGEELAKQVRDLRQNLLLQMIDRKILVDHAKRMFQDMEKVREGLYQSFKQQQDIKTDEELQRALAQEGLTVQELKDRLVELYAPEEVIKMEVQSRIGLSESEIEAYYLEHPDEFRVPAEVKLREIVLLAGDEPAKEKRKGEMEEIKQRLAGGEEFGELAREVSEAGTREEGGLLGPMRRGDLAPPIEAQAFSIPVGTIGEPVETAYGFHIIKVESRSDDHAKPLDEVREPLRRMLEQRKSVQEMDAFLKKARAEAEWCVKPRYREMLSVPLPEPCESL